MVGAYKKLQLLIVALLWVVQVKGHGNYLRKMKKLRSQAVPFNISKCSELVSKEIKEEIKALKKDVDRILHEVVNATFKGKTYSETVKFVDRFGPRMPGTENLNRSILYLKEKMKLVGNVTEEPVEVYAWSRVIEKCHAILGWRNQSMRISAMGGSISTPKGGIEADVFIINSISEIWRLGNRTRGKILIVNIGFDQLKSMKQCYYVCPDMAANAGAVALLLRSPTPFSMNTPHTGMIMYNMTGGENYSIPVASITIEDADYLVRLLKSNSSLKLHLEIDTMETGMVPSSNIFVDLEGSTKKNELIVMTANSDSWDIGLGAMDNAAGLFVSLTAAEVLKHLNLTTNRTIRSVIFTGEETGYWGGAEYYKNHVNESNATSLMFEARCMGFGMHGIRTLASENATCIMNEILTLLEDIHIADVSGDTFSDSNLRQWNQEGVPLGGLSDDDIRYYFFHNTDADRINILQDEDMDVCTATFTAVSYVIARLEDLLPRTVIEKFDLALLNQLNATKPHST